MSSTYKIKKSNQPFINALVRYCKDVPLFSLDITDGDDTITRDLSKKNYTFKDLPALLPTIQAEEFSITCSSSIVSVFPQVNSDQLMAAITDVSNDEMSILTDNETLLKSINGHLNYVMAGRLGARQGYSNFDNASKELAKARTSLSKTEALLLLQHMDNHLRNCDRKPLLERATMFGNDKTPEQFNAIMQTFKISSMMLLPEQNTFIFCMNHDPFYLRFGDKPKLASLSDEFRFDLDDGFLGTSWAENLAEIQEPILAALQPRFEKWKASGYKGELIAAHESGLVEKVAPVAVSSSGMFGQSNNQSKIDHFDEICSNAYKH